MTFGESIKTCLNKSFTFNGRASRSEFWYWILLVNLIDIGFLIFMFKTDINPDTMLELFWAYKLCLAPTTISAEVRRMHDINQSGWFVWCQIIPAVGWMIFLNWAIEPSYDGDNRYGAKPQ